MCISDVVVIGMFGLFVLFGVYVIVEYLFGLGVFVVVVMGFYVGYNFLCIDYMMC